MYECPSVNISISLSDMCQVDGNISMNEFQEQNHIPVLVTKREPSVNQRELRKPVLRRVKRSNKLMEATKLPSVMNLNPRSIYNKIDEFLLLVEQYGSDLIFLSETWDRVSQPLQSLIQLENYEVITSVNPRSFRGGQPALVINEEKFHIKKLNPEPITVPEGVEAVWALLTPKFGSTNGTVKHIAVAAIYYRGPKSTKKRELFDHIAESYNLLMAKYGDGLHFILAGDTNRLNLSPILNLSPSLKQVVTCPTRLDPEAILGPIITTLKDYFQTPITKPPIENDADKDGKPSDHLVVIMPPVSAEINFPTRQTRTVQYRPLPQSGIDKMGQWIQRQTWHDIYKCSDAHQMAEVLQTKLLESLDKFLPMKTVKFSSDDDPWVSKEIKDLDRRRKREFFKHHKSEKWKNLNSMFQSKCKEAKESYYSNIVEDLKESNTRQWYSKVKRMSGKTINSDQNLDIEEFKGKTDEEQAELIADFYAKVSNEYKPIEEEPIDKNLYETNEAVPHFTEEQIYERIMKMSSRKSTVRNDVPMQLIKEFSVELSTPLYHIFNFSMENAQYPNIWKFQSITPAQKAYPTVSVKQLRPISGLLNFAKIYESFLAEIIAADMAPTKDTAQYGNEKSVSIQHYLVKMIHTILSALDKNSQSEANAVICQLVDWQGAFDRQCHTLGVKSFLENGVRKSIIPLLINYFTSRQMAVKWKGKYSQPRYLPGGGAQGGALGGLEYLSQTNHNVDFLDEDKKYKFIDDLSILEVINLIMCGISSYNFKNHVASDIGTHGKFLSTKNYQSQNYLNMIQDWTKSKQMALNNEKCKYMIFNFTRKYQFSTRLGLSEGNLQEISECKLLGLVLTSDLSFEQNTDCIIKNAFKRMIMIRKLSEFDITTADMHIYCLCI